MYLVIVDEDMLVKEIIKNPKEERKQEGYLIEDLKTPGNFTEKDGELYFIGGSE